MPETATRATNEAASGADEKSALHEWSEALDAMERHLEELRAGLERGEPMPTVYVVHAPQVSVPRELVERARHVAIAQNDLEIALRERVSMLGAALHAPSPEGRVDGSFYVDRRA